METVKAPRNTSVELLRFAFMYLILLIHVYGHGTGLDYERIYLWGANPGTAPHLALFSLGKIGVTGFMFISGYYGIHATRGKAVDLILTTLFYLLVLTPIGGGFGKLLYLHPFDGWWFVSAYLFIMCLAPIIEAGIKAVPRQTFRNIVIAMLAYTYIAQALWPANSHDAAFLLTVYLAASYFKLHLRVKICKRGGVRRLRTVGACSLLLLLLVPILASMAHLPMKVLDMFEQNNNPLLLVISCWLVYEADTHSFSSAPLNRLLQSTLAIYLITDAINVRPILTQALLPEVMRGTGFAYMFVICIACLLADQIRIIIFNCAYKAVEKIKHK